MNLSLRARLLAAAAALLVAPLLLACVLGGSTTQTAGGGSPRWACPSPTPRPYGPEGPLKDVIRHPRPTIEPAGPVEYDEENIYYEPWEQEYGGQLSGPPYPTPTPYAMLGTSYVFGQRVLIEPLYATVKASADTPLGGGRQLYRVQITWNNPTGAPIAVDYGVQVVLRSVAGASGRVITGDGWGMSTEALAAAATTAPAGAIPPGESLAIVPIIAPAGTPQTVDIAFIRSAADTLTPGAAPSPSPTPNPGLRQTADARVVVQWTNSTIAIGPPCGDPGAMTAWESGGAGWGHEALPVAAPPGSSRVVQLALNQVGKPYVWGHEGPETFDCSGLMQWAYSQINIKLLRTAQQQHDSLRPIAASELQPGDLVFFSPQGRRGITHVAMFIGDLDGDGRADIVHAMSPEFGVRVTNNIFGSRYYSGASCKLCIAGFGTLR